MVTLTRCMPTRALCLLPASPAPPIDWARAARRLDLAPSWRGHLLPNGTISARFQHLLALAERFAFYATALRAGISHATDVEDAGSAAVYTDISRGVEKRLWFLEAHLHHCGTRAAP
jgi:hypothetical protein